MKRLILLMLIVAALSGCSSKADGKSLLERDRDYYQAMIDLNDKVGQNVWNSIDPALDAIKTKGSDYSSTNESLEKAYKAFNGYLEEQEKIKPTPNTEEDHKRIHTDMLFEKKALEALIKYSENGDRQPFIDIMNELSEKLDDKYSIINDYKDRLSKMESAK